MLAQLAVLSDMMNDRPLQPVTDPAAAAAVLAAVEPAAADAAAAEAVAAKAVVVAKLRGKEAALERRRRGDLVMLKTTVSSRQYGAKLRMLYTPAVAQDAPADQPMGYMPPTRLYDDVPVCQHCYEFHSRQVSNSNPNPSPNPNPNPNPNPTLTLTLALTLTLTLLAPGGVVAELTSAAHLGRLRPRFNPNPDPDPTPNANPNPNL